MAGGLRAVIDEQVLRRFTLPDQPVQDLDHVLGTQTLATSVASCAC
jgi:hypothetical protein